MVWILSGLLALGGQSPATGEELESGEFFVTQSWSQETDFKRPYFVNVPKHAVDAKLPVFVFLHGNGGNAKGAMTGFLRRHPTMAARYIMVFPEGYLKSWNIVSERSKADDREFIEAIIKQLAGFEDVQPNNFSIMGSSNGAALVNQLAIECRLPNVRNYVTSVSPLNVYQHDGMNFKAKGEDNHYQTVATPMTSKRLMNVSGTEDRLIPYHGGRSRVIPAKGGKLGFIDAEESTFLWAKQMGYEGEKLSQPTDIDGKLHVFSYLDGDVIHLKVVGEGHGATHAISEEVLLGFLEGGHVGNKRVADAAEPTVPTVLAKRGKLILDDDGSEARGGKKVTKFDGQAKLRAWAGNWERVDSTNIWRSTWKPGMGHSPVASYQGIQANNLIIEVTFRYGEMTEPWHTQCFRIAVDNRPTVTGHIVSAWANPNNDFIESGFLLQHIRKTTEKRVIEDLLLDHQPLAVEPNVWYTATLEVADDEALFRMGDHVAYAKTEQLRMHKNLVSLTFGTTWHEIRRVRIWEAKPNAELAKRKADILQSRKPFQPTAHNYTKP